MTNATPTYEVTAGSGRDVVRLRVYPGGDNVPRPASALLWMHGGGFAGGSLDMPEGDAVCRSLAERGTTCVSVDYRLAPPIKRWRSAGPGDVHFPVPVGDCERGWQWLAGNAGRLGADLQRLYIGGASAGGALAATLALRLRDREVVPAGVVLAYPFLHQEFPPFSDGLRASIRGWRRIGTFPRSALRRMARNYVGPDHLNRLPEAFPGGSDLSGFPPALIINSDRDTLRASGERFAEELREHRRPVDASYEPGTSHGHLNRPQQPAFLHSITLIASWLATTGEALTDH